MGTRTNLVARPNPLAAQKKNPKQKTEKLKLSNRKNPRTNNGKEAALRTCRGWEARGGLGQGRRSPEPASMTWGWASSNSAAPRARSPPPPSPPSPPASDDGGCRPAARKSEKGGVAAGGRDGEGRGSRWVRVKIKNYTINRLYLMYEVKEVLVC